MPLPALFIGRFQPVHIGHMDALKQIFKREKRVLIGIGSAEKNFSASNPFTAGERYLMLESLLKYMKIPCSRYAILPARDIHNDATWVKHLETLFPPFERVYTGSLYTKQLFTEAGGYTKTNGHEVVDLEKRIDVSATLVRETIQKTIQKNEDLSKLIPKPVLKLLKKWNAIKRIKSL